MKVCLIGGAGRTGTTILKDILNVRTDSIATPEWRGVIDPHGLLDFYYSNLQMQSPYYFNTSFTNLKELLYKIGGHRRNKIVNATLKRIGNLLNWNRKHKLTAPYYHLNLQQFIPDYFELTDQFLEDIIQFKYAGTWVGNPQFSKAEMYHGQSIEKIKNSIANYIDQLLKSLLRHNNAQYYVDDNTWNILYFDKILEFIPQAKLVHIKRNSLDTISSQITKPWASKKAIETATIYHSVIERWDVIKTKVPQQSFLEVDLYDLVDNPKLILEEICSFYGIPFDEKMLTIKLNKSNKNRWLNNISEKDSLEILKILKG